MVAVRDAEIAARSIGLNPVSVKAAAFMLSAFLAGIAGGIFASLLAFVAPDSFPFSQSILFLFAVVVGGAPLRVDPPLLLHSQESWIESALVELQQILADLLNPARNAVTMERSECFERSQDEENQGALEDIRLIGTFISH